MIGLTRLTRLTRLIRLIRLACLTRHANRQEGIMARSLASFPLLTAAAVLLAAAGCDSDECSGADCDTKAPAGLVFEVVDAAPAAAPAGTLVAAPLQLRASLDGVGLQAADLEVTVERGGGEASVAVVPGAEEGLIALSWTLGAAPVLQRLRVALAADPSVAALVWQTVATPDPALQPSPFGDVDGWLAAANIKGSTEDLAFGVVAGSADIRLVIGVPGGLAAMATDGSIAHVPLTGDPIDHPLGVAFDSAGVLWVADSEGLAVRRVAVDGTVTTPFTTDGKQAFVGPNFVATMPGDRILVSDPCLGELIRFNTATSTTDAIHAFDLPTEGGPNGFAFDATGERLFVVTENTALLCNQTKTVKLDAPLASLYVIDFAKGGFGVHTPVEGATQMGLFGDGMAFDGEGNLFFVIDTQKDFALDESQIWVLPAEGGPPAKVLAVKDQLIANVAFGHGGFGPTLLYASLLSVEPFTPPESRGVVSVDLGLTGQALIPPMP